MEGGKAELGLAHKARRQSGKGKPHDFQMATAADEGRKWDWPCWQGLDPRRTLQHAIEFEHNLKGIQWRANEGF